MQCITLDLETSIHNSGDEAIGTFKASPFHPKNRIVYLGVKELEGSCNILKSRFWSIPLANEPTTLVGANIKFDLLYLLKELGYGEWLKNINIWDIQTVEYMLSGHTWLYPKLDDMAVRVGGTVKDSKIKEYWDAGISTEDIPEAEIVPYLEGDLNNTELVFLDQVNRVSELGMDKLVAVEMKSLLCSTLMEFNGMHFDKGLAAQQGVEISYQIELHRQYIFDLMLKTFTTNLDCVTYDTPQTNVAISECVRQFSPDSNVQLSALIYGGQFAVKVQVPMLDDKGNVIKFKSGVKKGEEKLTWKVVEVHSPGLLHRLRIQMYPPQMLPSGIFPTSSDELTKFARSVGDTNFSRIIAAILEYRTLCKDYNTYYLGYSSLVWPDGCIHPTLNHAATSTSRKSCVKPNLQNITTKDT